MCLATLIFTSHRLALYPSASCSSHPVRGRRPPRAPGDAPQARWGGQEVGARRAAQQGGEEPGGRCPVRREGEELGAQCGGEGKRPVDDT
jgi:hypothetical protein